MPKPRVFFFVSVLTVAISLVASSRQHFSLSWPSSCPSSDSLHPTMLHLGKIFGMVFDKRNLKLILVNSGATGMQFLNVMEKKVAMHAMHSGIVEEWWEWKTALLAISSFTPYFSPGKQRSTTYRRRREDWFLWNGGQSLYVCGKGLVNQKMSRDESEYVVQKEQFTCPTAGTLWNGPEFVHLRRIMNTTTDGVGLLVGPWPWSSLPCTFSCRNWSSFQVHLLPRPEKENTFSMQNPSN